LCSGPAGIGLAFFVVANDLPEQAKELLGLFALVVVLGGALVLGCIARARLPVGAPLRLHLFANIAVVAPIAWCIAIVAFIVYAMSQL
jgi:hypothetical protein